MWPKRPWQYIGGLGKYLKKGAASGNELEAAGASVEAGTSRSRNREASSETSSRLHQHHRFFSARASERLNRGKGEVESGLVLCFHAVETKTELFWRGVFWRVSHKAIFQSVLVLDGCSYLNN
ncbi:hypothetical protein NL676_032101 [Syzygium grande]|nr:hypothetical protein NL676_032101 [Syzygium grande]